MANTNNYPVRGQVYTLAEILTLTLRDSPFLRFFHNDRMVVVQTLGSDIATVCEDNPKLLESKWTYIRETDEWIPLFTYAGEEPVTDYVQISPTRRIGYEAEQSPYYVRFVSDSTPELTPYEEEQLVQEKVRLAEQARQTPSLAELMAQPSPHFSFKEVVQSIITIPKFTTEEMLQDPAKAKAYVEARGSIAQEFLGGLVWDCSAEPDYDKARLFSAGTVHRYKQNHTLRSVYWGMVDLFDVGGEKRAPVYFKTEDCFVAWVLKRFG